MVIVFVLIAAGLSVFLFLVLVGLMGMYIDALDAAVDGEHERQRETTRRYYRDVSGVTQ